MLQSMLTLSYKCKATDTAPQARYHGGVIYVTMQVPEIEEYIPG